MTAAIGQTERSSSSATLCLSLAPAAWDTAPPCAGGKAPTKESQSSSILIVRRAGSNRRRVTSGRGEGTHQYNPHKLVFTLPRICIFVSLKTSEFIIEAVV